MSQHTLAAWSIADNVSSPVVTADHSLLVTHSSAVASQLGLHKCHVSLHGTYCLPSTAFAVHCANACLSVAMFEAKSDTVLLPVSAAGNGCFVHATGLLSCQCCIAICFVVL